MRRPLGEGARFWREAGVSHLTLTTTFNRHHHRRVPGRAVRCYRTAVADLL